jgi:hypothetical protein
MAYATIQAPSCASNGNTVIVIKRNTSSIGIGGMGGQSASSLASKNTTRQRKEK